MKGVWQIYNVKMGKKEEKNIMIFQRGSIFNLYEDALFL